MKTLHIGEFKFQLPEMLNEMKVPELVFLSKLISVEIPIQEIKIKILFFCLNAKRLSVDSYQLTGSEPLHYKIAIGKRKFVMNAENIMMATEAFDYLFTAPDKNGNCFFDNQLTVNPFPELKIGGTKLYSPAEALTDISYNRYIYLETYYSVIRQKPEAALAFLAWLFLERKKEFNPDELNLEKLQKVKPEVVILMCWFYIGSIRFIGDKFPRIFPADSTKTQSGNPFDGQMNLLDLWLKIFPDAKIVHIMRNGVDVAKVMGMLRQAIKNLKGWDVMEQVVLGNFSFSKLILWKDIVMHHEELLKSDMVRSLVDGKLHINENHEPHSATDFDNINSQSIVLPIATDVSQMEAVLCDEFIS